MMKRKNKKGFTLAELLIVVAIIAVLVAIAIPVFSNQLNKAKAATQLANARSTYAEAVTSDMLGESYSAKTYDRITYTPTKNNNGTWKVALEGDGVVTATYTFPINNND